MRPLHVAHFSNRQYDRATLLSDEQAAALRDLHREGNAALFARYIPDLDPAELGYV